MRRLLFFACLLATAATAAEWRSAEPGWQYEFPRDHHAHDDFKTEWWYFTGNLSDAAGHRFGYQLTFFRQGIRPSGERDPAVSRFVVGDLKFAHFTVTDVSGNRFRFEQKTNRGAFGEAGFDDGERLAWIDSWTLRMTADGAFHLVAEGKDAAIDLRLAPRKPPAIHGEGGLSQKAFGEGHASHYYSLTRLETAGDLRLGVKHSAVHGDSWFDHEWATNQLAPEQVGWNWLSVHFDNGTELMLYQMRLANGEPDPTSSGTWIAEDGSTTHLPGSAFRMIPAHWWTSPKSGAKYPIGWQIELPERHLRFEVRPMVDAQELTLLPLTYWEGAVEINGSENEKPVTGRGYLELTGYGSPLRELQR